MFNRSLPRRAVSCAVLLVLLSGCGPAVVGTREPLYNRDRDAVFEPQLLGEWHGPDAGIRFTRGADKSYLAEDLRLAEDGSRVTEETQAYDLVRVGDRLYLFWQLAGAGAPGVGTVFNCMQVRLTTDELRIRWLDIFELARRLRREPEHLQVEAFESADRPAAPPSVVLTSDAATVRRYLVDHEDDPKLFVEAEPLVRRR